MKIKEALALFDEMALWIALGGIIALSFVFLSYEVSRLIQILESLGLFQALVFVLNYVIVVLYVYFRFIRALLKELERTNKFLFIYCFLFLTIYLAVIVSEVIAGLP